MIVISKPIINIFTIWILLLVFATIPVVKASPMDEASFPNLTFKAFSDFISQHFSSKTSLSTVLVILFSLTENPDLLSLHARQQYTKDYRENQTVASGWIKGLACAVKENIGQNQKKPLKMKNINQNANEEEVITALSIKLDGLSKLLGLSAYDQHGHLQGKLKPISHKSILPVHVICPIAMECETAACNSWSLHQITPTRDIPQVTLIKGSVIYENICVLTGQCPSCKTKYFADHERAVEDQGYSKVYLNSAKYLKIGQSLWVDRIFSNGVVNATYSFHASVFAYAEYWNNTFWKHQLTNFNGVARRQIWQAFVQETICTIADASHGQDLILRDGLAIDEVVKEAFAVLGADRIIAAASHHSCSECTQEYKKSADIIPAAQTSAANESNSDIAEPIVVDKQIVTMVVLDGIVMGPSVSSKYYA
jgi:hypothetical protein